MNEIQDLREKSKQLRKSRKQLRESVTQIFDLFGDKTKCARCDEKELSDEHCRFYYYGYHGSTYTNDESEVKDKVVSTDGTVSCGGGNYIINEDIHTFIPKIEIKEVTTYEQINTMERLVFFDGHLFVSELSYNEYHEVSKVGNNILKTIIEDDLITKILTNLSKKVNGQLKDYDRVKEIAQTLANVINPRQDEVIAK